jgi:SAM-dependent methyltransferase
MQKKLFLFLLCSISTLASDALTSSDIQEIYEKYVLVNYTEEYRTRYYPLPMYKNKGPWKWEGKDFPRVIAVLEFERFVLEKGLSSKKGLAINGVDPEWDFLPHKTIQHICYDDDPDLYDLHTLEMEEKDYDFILLNQTLEHLYDPIRCLKNIYRHMRKGGIIYINVPANSIPHSTPYHYYTGYTPVGLGAVLVTAGFKILSIGQWGNLEYLKAMQSTYKWPDYRRFLQPNYNDISHPIITWIFAVKN